MIFIVVHSFGFNLATEDTLQWAARLYEVQDVFQTI